jgi:hypothetical protein
MKMRKMAVLLVIALLVSTLAACAPVQAPAASSGFSPQESNDGTPTVAAGEEAVAAEETALVVPVDPAECEATQMAIAERLGVELTMEVVDFASEIAGLRGMACTLSATGTGEVFGNFVDTAQAIREVLLAEGWVENPNHIADGPTGTASGFEKENQVALVQVDWEPSEDAECPAHQPISACDLESSQQLFTVVVELAQAS